MKQGLQTWVFKHKPRIISSAAVVGPDEAQGPLKDSFDKAFDTLEMDEKSWEKAEQVLLKTAIDISLQKGKVSKSDIDLYIGGDLLNQLTTNSFVIRDYSIPYFGVFGACSTSMEALTLVAALVDGGYINKGIAATCSHNCTVEKQFRYPTEYGSQKPPYSQYTVTGAGVAVVSTAGDGPYIECATVGKINDLGMTDPFNMGGAMAPAAVDTIITHLNDMNRKPSDYDLIITGDLASVGHPIVKDLLKQEKVPIDTTTFNDCGLMIYDLENQDVNAGGSGAGCSAVVTYGHIMKQLNSGQLKRVLIVATGALLSPLTYQQGDSIPCIAHAVSIVGKGVD